MKAVSKILLGTAMGAALLAFSSVGASAAIVCTGDTCWHVQETYEYPSTAHVIVHPDDWRWGPSDHYVFREHEGRGYWHGDTWSNW